MTTLTFNEYIILASIIIGIITILIHMAVLRRLSKLTKTEGVTDKIGDVAESLANSAAKVLKTLNLDGVADLVNLVKDLITNPEPAKTEGAGNDQDATNN